MLNFFFLSILISLSLPGFAQEGTVKEPLSPQGGRVIIQGAPPASEPAPVESEVPAGSPAGTTVTPAHPADAYEDADIQELEADRLKRLEKMNGIEATTAPLANPVMNPLEEIQRLGHKQIDAAAMLDEKVLAILQKTLKTGVMSKLPPEEVKKMLQEKFKDSLMGGILTKFPKLLNILVDLMRDKDALAGLLGIMIRKPDLKEYGYICLALFVFGLFVKNRIIKPKWPFFKRLRYSMSVSLVLTSISFYLFYSYFGTEISPTIEVISKHF
jgi:hypothetical protein